MVARDTGEAESLAARPSIEAVIFDWGGTLTPWHTVDLREQWRVFAAGYGRMACALEDLASRLYAADDAAWAKGRGPGHPSATLDEVLQAAGVDPASEAAEAGLRAYREFWLPHTITHPDVEPLFLGLRERGLKVGVLSNTIWDRGYHRGIFERDEVAHLIDADVYSSEIAHIKPHPEIFRETARRLGVDVTDCVYVGDRPYEDIHGAHDVGMRAILIPHSDIPANQQADLSDTLSVPDAVAHELIDILGIIDGWRAG